MGTNEVYDVVVVGSGAAGAVAASRRSLEWIEAEKEVITMAATSSMGRDLVPSSVLQVSWPSLQLREQVGPSMLTM